MRDRVIACFLSFTLFFSSVFPVQLAYAEPVLPEEDVEVSELVEPDYGDTELIGEEGVSDGDLDGGSDSISDSVVSGLSFGEESEVIEFLPSEQSGTYATPRAAPVVAAAALKYLAELGISTVVSSLIANALSSDEDIALLTGILSAILDTNDILDGIRDYGKLLASQGNSTLIILERVESYLSTITNRLKYEDSSGTVHNVASLLYNIRDRFYYTDSNGTKHTLGALIYSMMKDVDAQGITLSSILDRFYYTDSNGVKNSLGAILYSSLNRLKAIDEDIDILPSLYERFYYTHTDGTKYSLGLLLYRIYKGIDSLDGIGGGSTDDVLPEVIVVPNSASDALENAEFMDELVGSLDTVLIASQLDELALVLEKAFPFCLVFGLVAIIDLLIAPADAPSFDFPLPDGSGGTYLYTVDLEMFDPAAGVFRAMITIIYILGLIRITHSFVFKGGED